MIYSLFIQYLGIQWEGETRKEKHSLSQTMTILSFETLAKVRATLLHLIRTLTK